MKFPGQEMELEESHPGWGKPERERERELVFFKDMVPGKYSILQ